MRWANKNPEVEVINKVYEHGVKLSKKEMDELDKGFSRKAGIEKWFVQITPRAGWIKKMLLEGVIYFV
jgi:hypothetical protein